MSSEGGTLTGKIEFSASISSTIRAIPFYRHTPPLLTRFSEGAFKTSAFFDLSKISEKRLGKNGFFLKELRKISYFRRGHPVSTLIFFSKGVNFK